MNWRRILLSLFGFLAFGCFLPAGAFAIPAKPEINHSHYANHVRLRVLLTDALTKADVRGFDLSIFQNGKLAAQGDRLSTWEFRCHDGRIRATPITAHGAGETLELKEPVSVQTPAGFLSFKGRPYREELSIYSNGSFCEVINVLDIEKYLDGLVNAEFSSRWDEEAVAAQVVAARTYAYYQMLQAKRSESPARHYDVDSTTRDQVYDGSVREDFRASRAVEKSRGLVLTAPSVQGAAPIKAFYHSTCGGTTELPQNVWGSPFPGFKRAVRCGYCWPSPAYAWKEPLRGKEIAELFRAGARKDGIYPGWPAGWERVLRKGQLVDLRVSHISPQGRVLKIKTLWADGPLTLELSISGARFREWIGSGRLKSAVFQVAGSQGRVWNFKGRGFGHGVGMCQWGAKIMGDKGYKMATILKHYYPDATLRRLW